MEHEFKIVLPKLGESIVSATVVQWFKKEGDFVSLDEPLLEVSTDKVNSEIPSPKAGILHKILARVDEEILVGAPLAILHVGAATASSLEKESVLPAKTSTPNDTLSPAVLRLLQESNIPLSEIDHIARTGEGGRMTRKDVEQYAQNKKAKPFSCPREGVEKVKMSQLRKAIAENMVRSFYEAPHASLMTEVDVTEVVRKIEEQKAAFLEKHGAKLSITTVVAKAIALAVAEYPFINASLEDDTIVIKRFVNLGIAVSVDQGVMVPVLRHCEKLSLPEIALKIAELAKKAREQTLLPSDVQEGTMTMTNFGMTGTMIGIPIIRYPEVAIVGLGAIVKKAVPIEGDAIAVRSMMWVSLTFDHRVLDGLYGCGFLNALKTQLENGAMKIFS